MDKECKTESGEEPVCADDLRGGETEFRTVSHLGRRYAIRLEPVFWKVLELAAKHRNDRLAAYVGDILGAAGDKKNRTSILRVHAVGWLSRRLLDSATQGLGQKSIDAISAASVQPVFSIGRDNEFTGHNAAFYEMLRGLTDDAHTDIGLSQNLSVTFKSEVADLKIALAGARKKFVEDRIIIKIGGKSVEKAVRVAALESAAGQHTGFYVIVC